ncbi:crotonase [Thioclava nitratireducens]|uniref:Crotonase n=1 Tax=Thioclava nitratireducens TaxID=1915078 RepID=A0ABM6II45_9RHOB|nr:crotonase/enoyl-CoA hydratase family protein [Thioclava nitratireducens]AQS48424.1 crotonase [Thioclava nitratireducens]
MSPVLFETRGNIAIITLNRPERRNAINAEAGHALAEAVARLEADDALQIGILRGEGAVFCAGMDLAAFTEGKVEELLFAEGGFGGLTQSHRSKPIIATCHGAALAGGFELALGCDMIVAEEGCRFGLPEVLRGLVAGAGGALRLASLIPPARARELLLTGRLFDTAEAWELGLIARRAEAGQAFDAALALAEEVAKNAPLALRETLRLSREIERRAVDPLWEENARTLKAVMESEDAAEGARAFLEKRAPEWSGR